MPNQKRGSRVSLRVLLFKISASGILRAAVRIVLSMSYLLVLLHAEWEWVGGVCSGEASLWVPGKQCRYILNKNGLYPREKNWWMHLDDNFKDHLHCLTEWNVLFMIFSHGKYCAIEWEGTVTCSFQHEISCVSEHSSPGSPDTNSSCSSLYFERNQ